MYVYVYVHVYVRMYRYVILNYNYNNYNNNYDYDYDHVMIKVRYESVRRPPCWRDQTAATQDLLATCGYHPARLGGSRHHR